MSCQEREGLLGGGACYIGVNWEVGGVELLSRLPFVVVVVVVSQLRRVRGCVGTWVRGALTCPNSVSCASSRLLSRETHRRKYVDVPSGFRAIYWPPLATCTTSECTRNEEEEPSCGSGMTSLHLCSMYSNSHIAKTFPNGTEIRTNNAHHRLVRARYMKPACVTRLLALSFKRTSILQ